MALEDLTGPAKFIDSLVPGNPVSNDDRREGDDHIRGIKNVLRNTFPNINGATTVSDEELSALAAALPLAMGALLKAANLSDLASAVAARVNLGLQDANGHFFFGKPLTAGQTLALQGFADAGAPLLGLLNAAGQLNGYFAHNSTKLTIASVLLPGAIGLAPGNYEGFFLNDQGEVTLTQRVSGTTATLLTLMTQGPGWGLWMQPAAGASGNLQVMFFPGTGAKYLALTATGTIAAPDFNVSAAGAGARLILSGDTVALSCASAPATLVGAAIPDASNDGTIAHTFFVHAHTAAGKGSVYQVQVSPAFGTAYQNATNRPRFVSAIVSVTSAGDWLLETSPDGTTYGTVAEGGASAGPLTLSALVPPGHFYRVRTTAGVATFARLSYTT